MNLKHRFIKTDEYDNTEARIAELEAEIKTVRQQKDNQKANNTMLLDKWEQAEAERDALRDRRCEGCEAYSSCSVRNAAWVRLRLEPDFQERGFYCNRWFEKSTP